MPETSTCFECGAEAQHEHHVVPASLGGERSVPLCERCHAKAHHNEDLYNGSEGASHSELTEKGLEAARARGDGPGRPNSLGEGDIELAQDLMQDPEVRVEDITSHFGISSATLYRYVSPNGKRRK
jgi:hypothetical protein